MSLPTGRLEVVTLATPLVRVPVPSEVDPLMNVTVPVGVPVPGLTTTTVALIVTGCPKTGEVGVELMVVVVDAWPTVSTVAVEVWPLKLVSPEYTSVIELAPSASALVVMLPDPDVRVADPSVCVPFMNTTLPVGVPAPGLTACTVAVRATDWPKTGAVVDGVNVVVVVACATAIVTPVDVLGLKFESPKYWAEIVLVVTGSVETFRVPDPFVPSGTMPSEAEPLKNWTFPLGVGDPVGPVTVAVSATVWPKTAEVGTGVTTV